MTLNRQSFLTSHEVADLLQVDPSSVKNWVNAGRLEGFKTPGGHRRVRVDALVDFLSRYSMPIPSALFSAFKTRVLVADPDPTSQRSLSRLLKTYASSLDMRFTKDACSALFIAGEFKPQVMLMSTRLTDLDTLTLCEKLNKMPSAKGIRLIIMTGDPRPALVKQATAAGADAVLAKPFTVGDLLGALQLDQRFLTRAAVATQ